MRWSLSFAAALLLVGGCGQKLVSEKARLRAHLLSETQLENLQSDLDAHHERLSLRQQEPVPRVLIGNQNPHLPEVR